MSTMAEFLNKSKVKCTDKSKILFISAKYNHRRITFERSCRRKGIEGWGLFRRGLRVGVQIAQGDAGVAPNQPFCT